MKQNTGFTLIELMIVVAILAIIAAIVFPNYLRYVENTRRTDGQVALLDNAQRLERCFTTDNRYATCGLRIRTVSPEGFYTIAVAADNLTFLLTATPTGAQSGDRCGNLTLDHRGTRGFSGADGTPQACW